MDAKKDSLGQLLKKMHKELGREETAQGIFAMHGTLADYLLDAARPVRGTKPQIIAHIKERTAPSYAYGVNRRARALGLHYQSVRGKIILKNNKDATAFLANDAENSGLLLLDVSISRVLEKRMGKFVGSTYNMFARLTSMNSKRYYPGAENQHAEYINRCMLFPRAFQEKAIKVEDLIGPDGNADTTKFEGSVALLLDGILSQEVLVKLFDICGLKQACLRFKALHPAEGRAMLEQYPEVMPHTTDSAGRILYYQYTPGDAHPAHPLVSGPEDDVALAKVENLLEHWLNTEALTENHGLMDPLVKIDTPTPVKDKAPVIADTCRDLAVSALVDPPQPIRDIYYKAFQLAKNQTKAFLEHCGIHPKNGEIFSIHSGNHLPSLVVTATREAVSAAFNPSAIEVLQRVHWALTNKDLYTADVHPRLPKMPWYAALFLIIRQPVRYNIKGLVYDPKCGDYIHPTPRKSLKAKQPATEGALLAPMTDWNAVVEDEEKFLKMKGDSKVYARGNVASGSQLTFTDYRAPKGRPNQVQLGEDVINLRYSSKLPAPLEARPQRGGRGRGFSMRARGGMPRGGGMGRGGRAPVDLEALVVQMNSQFSAIRSDMAEMKKENSAKSTKNNM